MGVETPQLKHTIFGYSARNVRRLLADRDAMFLRAQEDARAAEIRLRDVEAELQAHRERIEEERAAREAVPEPEVTTSEGPALQAGSSFELTAVLEATEKAVTRLIEGARESGGEQLREAERRRGEINAEIDGLIEWRDRNAPLIGAVRGSLEDAQGQIASVPSRIDGALAPVTEALQTLTDRLRALANAAPPVAGPTIDDALPSRPPSLIHVDEARAPADEEERAEVVGDRASRGWGL